MPQACVQVEEVIASGVMKLSPGIKELVDILHGRGVRCYLISGGFTHMIHPIAKMLSISPDNVYANELRFDEDGAFQSFNPHALTCCSGGKGRVIAHIREFNGASGHAFLALPSPLSPVHRQGTRAS